jgi:hypothetical protein
MLGDLESWWYEVRVAMVPEMAGRSDTRFFAGGVRPGLVSWIVERFSALIHVAPCFAGRYDAGAWAEKDGIIGVAQIN